MRQFPGAGAVTRRHIFQRLLWCPFDEVAAHVPPGSSALDIGCGYGHFAAYLSIVSPGTPVLGCDPDAAKIAVAQRGLFAAPRGPHRFAVGHPWDVVGHDVRFDAVTFIDVLYLMLPERQIECLDWAAGRLAPGGRIVIRCVEPTPGWRGKLGRAREWTMVHLLRRTWTEGPIDEGRPATFYTEALAKRGLAVQTQFRRLTVSDSAIIVGRRSD